jgi:hypothetical protein
MVRPCVPQGEAIALAPACRRDGRIPRILHVRVPWQPSRRRYRWLGRAALLLGRVEEARSLGSATGARKARARPQHLIAATTMYREMGMTYWLEKAEAELRMRV